MSFVVVHLADLHFEQEKYKKCTEAADFILDQLKPCRPNLIAIAGDFWNGRQVLNSRSMISLGLEFVKRCAYFAPTVLVKGNEGHDAAGSYEIFRDLKTKHPVYVTERAESILYFDTKAVDEECFQRYGTIRPEALADTMEHATVLIHLMPYPEKGWFMSGKEGLSIDESNQKISEVIRNIFLGFGAISAGVKCPVILIGHGNISGAKVSSGQTILSQDVMLAHQDIALAGADIGCWGHLHLLQQVFPRHWYAGSSYNCNWGETEKKAFLLHGIDENKNVDTAIVPIPSLGMSTHDAEWDPRSGWSDEHTENDWNDNELRVRVKVSSEDAKLLTDEMIKKNYPGAFSYQIERIIVPVETQRVADIVNVHRLRDKVKMWADASGIEIREEVLRAADEVEKECAL